MARFQVALSAPLKGVESPNARVSVEQLPAKQVCDHQDALATLVSMNERLTRLQSSTKKGLLAIQNDVQELAIDLMEHMLGELPTLVHRRIERFLELAFEEVEVDLANQILVHPDCVDSVRDWCQRSQVELPIIPNQAVAPGDCIIESGNQGTGLTLDAYCDALRQSVRTLATTRRHSA